MSYAGLDIEMVITDLNMPEGTGLEVISEGSSGLSYDESACSIGRSE